MSKAKKVRLSLAAVGQQNEHPGKSVVEMADDMRDLWPGAMIMRREIPLFTRYYLSQADLCTMGALQKSPVPCGKINGECQYEKDLLLLWFREEGHLASGIGQPSLVQNIPGCWYEGGAKPPPTLDPYEVLLHRCAEEGAPNARFLLEMAVNWEGHHVAVTDVEAFTHDVFSLQAFTGVLVHSPTYKDLPGLEGRFKKWEFAFYLYLFFTSMPRFRISFIDNHLDSEERKVNEEKAFDPYEFETWLLMIARQLPTPVF